MVECGSVSESVEDAAGYGDVSECGFEYESVWA